VKKYVIFLDIDGVFASTRVHMGATSCGQPMWDKFDPVAVDFLNRLHDKHNIDFVLSSTWKNNLNRLDTTIFHWMLSSFRNAGFRGNFPYPNWKTNPNDTPVSSIDGRAHEVKHFLEACLGAYDDFVIIDDTDYRFNGVLGIKRFVKTDAENGMLAKHMKHILSLTGTWEKKT